MSYTTTDPRSTLAVENTPEFPRDHPVADPEFAEFSGEPGVTSPAGSRSWTFRGQNVVLVWTDAVAGDVFSRSGDTVEHVVLLPDADSALTVRSGAEEVSVHGQGLIAVPPGDSEIVVGTATRFVRLFETGVADVAAAAANTGSYAQPHPRVTPAQPWPEPVGGHRLRSWTVGDVTRSPDRFGRILRTRSFMVNFLFPHEGPRDAEKLSPHLHDDFEQLSLAVSGEFVHHVRRPWSPKKSQWRDDVHEPVGSPSLVVIPPPTEHTSEAVGPGLNQLFDIFAPPRRDFSAKPGWVLNADVYPAP